MTLSDTWWARHLKLALANYEAKQAELERAPMGELGRLAREVTERFAEVRRIARLPDGQDGS